MGPGLLQLVMPPGCRNGPLNTNKSPMYRDWTAAHTRNSCCSFAASEGMNTNGICGVGGAQSVISTIPYFLVQRHHINMCAQPHGAEHVCRPGSSKRRQSCSRTVFHRQTKGNRRSGHHFSVCHRHHPSCMVAAWQWQQEWWLRIRPHSGRVLN